MPSRFQIDAEVGIAEVSHHGSVGANELGNVVYSAMDQAGRLGITHFLTDATHLDGTPPLNEMLALCAKLHEQVDLSAFRHALLLPANRGVEELVRFWESACQNRGVQARCFRNRESAISWLKTGQITEVAPDFAKPREIAC